MKKKIYVYGVDSHDFETIQNTAQIIDAGVFGVNETDLNTCLNDLSQEHHETKKETVSYLFLIDLETDEIRKFVTSLNQTEYHFDGILVSKTEVNAKWKLTEIMEETFRERQYMEKQNELSQLIKQFDHEMMQKVMEHHDEETKYLLMDSFIVLKQGNADVEVLQNLISQLKQKYVMYQQ